MHRICFCSTVYMNERLCFVSTRTHPVLIHTWGSCCCSFIWLQVDFAFTLAVDTGDKIDPAETAGTAGSAGGVTTRTNTRETFIGSTNASTNTTIVGNVTTVKISAAVVTSHIGPIPALPLAGISAIAGPIVKTLLNQV